MTEPTLLLELASADPEQRRRAVIALGERPETGASRALLVALGDSEWRVRKEAVRVAREQAVSLAMLPRLVEAITQGDNVGLRNAALDVLEGLGAVAADVLIAALPTVPPEVRKFLIEALACGGDSRVVITLSEISRDADVMTAVTAIEAMSVIGGAVVERALRDHLGSSEALIRMAALDGLNRLGAALTWEQIHPLLSDRLVRRVAIAALGRVGRSEAVTPLVLALTDRSLHLARAAVSSLAQLQRDSADVAAEVDNALLDLTEAQRVRLRDLAADIDVTTRESAVQLLVGARDDVGLGEIIELAATDMLPPSAHEGLRRWGSGLARLLLQKIHTADERTRATLIELLSEAALDCLSDGPGADVALRQDVRQALRNAVMNGGAVLATVGARCMGAWAEAEDASLLVRAAARHGEDTAYTCGRALSRLAEREHAAVQTVADAVSLDGPAGAALTMLIASLGGPNTLARLQGALSAQEPATRKAAVHGLAALSDPQVGELIAFALADESPDVQMTAAQALGRLRDNDGKPLGTDALMLALTNESEGVRASVARALGATGDLRSIMPLRELVNHGSPGVIVAAIEGLRELGDADLGQLLAPALAHDDEEVVKQALYTIAEARPNGSAERIAASLSHRSWDVRRLAAELLGELGEASALPALRAQHEREVDELAREAMTAAIHKLVEG